MKYMVLLPEAILVLGIIFMLFVCLFRSANTQKTFFTISKWVMISALVGTIFLYNRSLGEVWHNNNYTTMFKVTVYLFALGWGTLSLKRFQSKGQSSFYFYWLLLINLLCFSIIFSYNSVFATATAFSLCQILNCLMLKIDEQDDAKKMHLRYILYTMCFLLMLWGGTFGIYHCCGTDNYAQIQKYLQAQTSFGWQLKLSFSLILMFLLFALGVAPLHFWHADVISASVLPVAGYLSFIPPLVYFSVFVNLMNNVFSPLYAEITPAILSFGVLSVFLGAIGANSEENMRRIFSYAGLYYTGVLMICATDMQEQSLQGAFIYLLVNSLSFFGIYTVLAGCRSKGEYLHNLNDVKGLSTQRPVLSATLLILMISLLGTPPLLGFLGKLSVINALIIGNHYALMAVVAFSILVLACAYLRIITSIYFEPRNISFDRVDKEVYLCIAVNVVLIVLTILNPKYLMHDIEMVLINSL